MDKIERGNPLTQSADIVKENLETLKRLFPTIVKEGKIDVDELKALIDDEVETSEEYYRFTWAGKSEARREANKPSTGTLRPNKADSINWDTTGNIFIEGDNLEVLKLMQKSYAGKIKMMYFDPPYNTGKDFVYKDNYTDNLGNYLEISNQVDSDGNKFSTNTESDGRYHSNWLNMMYPRLKLARNLLTEDGVIFISIDHNELHNLRKLMDELFGEYSFVEYFSWVKTSTPPGLSSKSRKTVEYILCYEKKSTNNKFNGELLDGGDQPLLNSGNSKRDLFFPKDKVKFNSSNRIFNAGIYDRVELKNDITIINGYSNVDFVLNGEFKWIQTTLDEEIRNGTTFIIKSDKFSIRFIREEEGAYKAPTNMIKEKYTSSLINKPDSNVGTNETASSELEDLLGGRYFDFPKPVSLIKHLANFCTTNNDIILDIFAGSCTTAHAVMQLNSEDNFKRNFICIQLPELIDTDSIAYKAGYRLITDISKLRLNKASLKLNSLTNNQLNNKFDFGFKAFKLDSSNINSWDGSVEHFETNLFNAQNNIKDDRTEEDVLYEILLKYGLDLTVPIQEKAVGKCKVYSIGAGVLFICLSDNITTEVAKAIGEWKKELEPATCRVLFKDNGFIDDVAKTNSVQILRQYGIEECNSI